MEQITCKKCGAKDDYRLTESGKHLKATCNICQSFIKFVKQQDFEFWFGKYKGTKLSEMKSPEQISWLEWCADNCNMLLDHHIELVIEHLRNNKL